MRRLILVLCLLALAAAAAASAQAAPAKTDPQVATLKRQVATLQRQVRGLAAEVQSARAAANAAGETAGLAKRTADTAASGIGELAKSQLSTLQLQSCSFAITFDVIYLMMYNDDLVFQALGASRVYGPRSGVDDRGACQAVGVTRTPWTAHSTLAHATPTMAALLRPSDELVPAALLDR